MATAPDFETYCQELFDHKTAFGKPEVLKGYRVLSCTQYILGPSCASYLAELGAEVIKIEAPRRLDLDHLGSQLSQVARTGGTEDVLRAGKNSITLQHLGLSESRLVIEELLTIGFEVDSRHLASLLRSRCAS